MEDLPQPVPGPELATLRKTLGVAQVDLAQRLGVHRVTLNGWERAATIDPIRAARYRKAVAELVKEAVA
jgi:DNA-binding transcriptional regulator YiaG